MSEFTPIVILARRVTRARADIAARTTWHSLSAQRYITESGCKVLIVTDIDSLRGIKPSEAYISTDWHEPKHSYTRLKAMESMEYRLMELEVPIKKIEDLDYV